MGENTKIEWAHHTFNPWVGCTKVGPGCDNCYAEDWAKRCGMVQWGPNAERRRTSERNWKLPIKWNAEAKRLGVRYMVFCSSLADVFDNAVPDAWRADLFKLIAATPHLDWMLLTKRIGNLQALIIRTCEELRRSRLFDAGGCSHDLAEGMCNAWTRGHPPRNVWIGATICNQEEADRDIPKLLAVPAWRRFLSIEPMLGPVDIQQAINRMSWRIGGGDAELHWVIAGGESGSKARPMHPDWPRSLRDQCAATNVPFLFKQWGEWEVSSEKYPRGSRLPDTSGRYTWISPSAQTDNRSAPEDNCYAMERVGKMKAGRLLDGVEHNAYPERAP